MSRHRRWSRIGRISLLAVWILGTSCAPSGPVIAIEPSMDSVHVGDRVHASVTVENIADLTAFEMHLSFDARALEVLELKNGEFIRADFIVQNTFDNAAGTIDFAVAQIEYPAANGSGTLLVIVFRAKAQGEFSIPFRQTPAVPEGALFSDSNGIAIPVSLTSGIIDISR